MPQAIEYWRRRDFRKARSERSFMKGQHLKELERVTFRVIIWSAQRASSTKNIWPEATKAI